MSYYALIEIDHEFEVVEVHPGQSPEEIAMHAGGELVDEGPFVNYEDAWGALATHEQNDEIFPVL